VPTPFNIAIFILYPASVAAETISIKNRDMIARLCTTIGAGG
jgi:hypothetical protein